ncbi:MAG: mandelate racemase/muconate lactonizing enzyme family protein, partial [Pseudomonadota bacterium]
MKITRIRVFQTPLPYVGGSYGWGAGNAIETATASVVVVDTDAGISGCGEFTPCGENYMIAHSQGVVAFARLAAEKLLGEDPRQVARMEHLMDHLVQGHGYAKAPFDAAFWDILGQVTGQPVWMLMGGKLTDGAPMYRVAPQKSVADTIAELDHHRAAGYRQFQIKVGADWVADIDRIQSTVPLLNPGEKAMADANQGWRVDNAIRVARACKDLDFILEQPCKTYDECQQVRRTTDLPMKLDECITDIHMARRIVNDR